MEENHFIDTLIINVENKYMVNSLYKSFWGYFHFLFVFPPNESRDIVRSPIYIFIRTYFLQRSTQKM